MPGLQLEDFNHALLRGIYSFYLAIFSACFFILGLAIVPLGYLAILGIRIRVLLQSQPVRPLLINMSES